MRGLLRFLMMFGPMIYRMYNKYSAKKSREQQQHATNQQRLENQQELSAPKDEEYV